MNQAERSYSFEPGRLFSHEIAVLNQGSCTAFLPTTFLYDQGRMTAVYDCRGYRPLSAFRIEHTPDILYILEKTLLLLQRSREYLFLPERIFLSPETVFYRQETGEVRITFVPNPDMEASLHRSLLQYLIWIKGDLCDTFQDYVSVFAHRICQENLGIEGMLTLVGLLRREVDRRAREIA